MNDQAMRDFYKAVGLDYPGDIKDENLTPTQKIGLEAMRAAKEAKEAIRKMDERNKES